jgi:hypothetical protein
MAFYGPGIKRGATIPYAEGPDVAIMTNYLLGLPPLRGHLDEQVPAKLRGVTGVFLANIFEGGPADVKLPRLIERYTALGDASRRSICRLSSRDDQAAVGAVSSFLPGDFLARQARVQGLEQVLIRWAVISFSMVAPGGLSTKLKSSVIQPS